MYAASIVARAAGSNVHQNTERLRSFRPIVRSKIHDLHSAMQKTRASINQRLLDIADIDSQIHPGSKVDIGSFMSFFAAAPLIRVPATETPERSSALLEDDIADF